MGHPVHGGRQQHGAVLGNDEAGNFFWQNLALQGYPLGEKYNPTLYIKPCMGSIWENGTLTTVIDPGFAQPKHDLVTAATVVQVVAASKSNETI